MWIQKKEILFFRGKLKRDFYPLDLEHFLAVEEKDPKTQFLISIENDVKENTFYT